MLKHHLKLTKIHRGNLCVFILGLNLEGLEGLKSDVILNMVLLSQIYYGMETVLSENNYTLRF